MPMTSSTAIVQAIAAFGPIAAVVAPSKQHSIPGRAEWDFIFIQQRQRYPDVLFLFHHAGFQLPVDVP